MPLLYIITGSNGAGKSSIGKAFLPENVQHLTPFDGDKIFLTRKRELRQQGIKLDKEVALLASEYTDEIFDKLINEALNTKSNFIYEGHFSEDFSWNTPKKFKEYGYELHLVFLGLLTVELSQSRVKERAFTGGHDVDLLTISMNYYGNMKKLNENFLLFNSIQILDTSETIPNSLALLQEGIVVEAKHPATLHGWFIKNLPAIHQLIQKWE